LTIKNISAVFDELDSLPVAAKTILFDSIREAGEIVSSELSSKAPKGGSGELARSFGVWQSKKLSRKYRAVVFQVGLKSSYFYSTLARGRKAHRRNGVPVKASKASHPDWLLPGEDESARADVLRIARSIFNSKIKNIDQIIGRRRKR
jgi:hypothetical protein